jgi:GH24 family phage-related lysozyme (muramidase)
MLFDQDFEHVLDDLNKPAFKNAYDKQNEARQAVLENMMFNLGATKLAGFKNFLKHMELQQYEDAVEHMQASKWWGQVGKRAKELAQMVATGEF